MPSYFRRQRLAAITGEHGVPALPSLEAAAKADAVVVATPTVTHRKVAEPLLAAGCHVLVEKPIAESLENADALVRAAEASGVVLAVGHVEFHNPAVQATLRLAEGIRHLEAQRLSPFTARSVDVDVVLDLMIHDIDLLLNLTNSQPEIVEAAGVAVITDTFDIVNARLTFRSTVSPVTNRCLPSWSAKPCIRRPTSDRLS